MSEQGQPSPVVDKSTSAPASWIDAYAKGDREGAQRMLDAENARAGIGGEAAPVDYTPPIPEPGVVDAIADDFRTTMGPEGEALIVEWGGVGDLNFGQNIAYVRHGLEAINERSPELVRHFFENPPDAAGEAALYRVLAEYGRQISHTIGVPVEPLANAPAPKGQGQRQMQNNAPVTQQRPGNVDAINRRIEEIYEANPVGSRGYAKPHVQQELQALFKALGDGPIVGRELSNG